jgi:hypothetical protein
MISLAIIFITLFDAAIDYRRRCHYFAIIAISLRPCHAAD